MVFCGAVFRDDCFLDTSTFLLVFVHQQALMLGVFGFKSERQGTVLQSFLHPVTPTLKSPRTSHCNQNEHLKNESGILKCKYKQTAGNYKTWNGNTVKRGQLSK